ncbi:MAG: hypothetical protein ACI822_001368, partial [Gammaproteobacteria bacterium]
LILLIESIVSLYHNYYYQCSPGFGGGQKKPRITVVFKQT